MPERPPVPDPPPPAHEHPGGAEPADHDRADRADHDPADHPADLASLDRRALVALAEGVEPDPEPAPRRWWVLPLRLAVSAAMLAVLYVRIPDFSWHELVPDWSTTAVVWLVVAVVLSAFAVALSAARWQRVLHGMGRPVPVRTLLPITFAGQFVSNVLPTTIGGDVLRVARLARRTGDSAEAFASVSLERLTGWLVLPLLSATAFALDPALRDLGRATSVALTIGAITLGGLIVILVAAGLPSLGGRLVADAGWRRFLGAVHLGLTRLRRRPADALGVVAAGVAFQGVLCVAAYAAARVAGIDVPVSALFAFYPAVLVAQVLPLGISGLGVREGAFVLFLEPLGVASEHAVALGLLLYLLNVVASLLGAPAFAAGSRRQSSSDP